MIFVQFKMNQSYIAGVLCENKNKPEMHCNGRCHLKKELDRDAQQDKNTNSGKDKYEVMFVETLQSFHTTPPVDQPVFNAYYKAPRLHSLALSVFHPPQLVVA
ncbi:MULTISPECIES: hypothetical protein [Chitinophaga]|uniref:hypothetical protein n=1 Tax=Chitinophaga TaxID=79328 RepID=UPI00115AF08F|nr:hypothetical protein [Chitinophaga polysaccharea]